MTLIARYDFNIEAMQRWGAELAGGLDSFDVIGLVGQIGRGKSTLARSIITEALTRANMPIEAMPSPTFTLVQPYPWPCDADPNREIWHIDLWRLESPDDVFELGWEEAIGRHLMLIEWPEKIGKIFPQDALTISIDAGKNDNERQLTISGGGKWPDKITSIAGNHGL